MPSVGNKNKGNEKWIKHVQAYRKKNRHLTWIQAMQAASSTYHKKKTKKHTVKKLQKKKKKSIVTSGLEYEDANKKIIDSMMWLVENGGYYPARDGVLLPDILKSVEKRKQSL